MGGNKDQPSQCLSTERLTTFIACIALWDERDLLGMALALNGQAPTLLRHGKLQHVGICGCQVVHDYISASTQFTDPYHNLHAASIIDVSSF